MKRLSMDETSLDAKRAEIDAKIQGHIEAIHSLKLQRNQLAPISRLSLDVLLSIFQWIQESPHSLWAPSDETRSHRHSKNPSQLMRTQGITHICSAWRTLAMNSPKLWTGLEFDCPPLTMEMCARSKSAPLTIYYRETDGGRNTRATLLSILTKDFSRVRFLSVSGFSTLWRSHMSHILRLGVPNALEGFWCKNISATEYGVRPSGEINLPIELLINSAPTLHSLGFLGCNFPKSSLTAYGTISLPLLQRIHILNPIQSCAEFLGCVTFPPSCTVTLESYDRAGDLSALQPFISKFSEARSLAGSPFDILRIGPDPQDTVGGLVVHLQSSILHEDSGLQLIVHYCGVVQDRATHIFLALLPCAQPEQITHLSLSCQADFPVWRYLAESCVRVIELVATNTGAWKTNGFSPLLIPRDSAANRPRVTPFPSMTTLVLCHFNIKDFRAGILRVVQNRFEAGLPVHRLLMDSGSIESNRGFSELVQEFQPFVKGEIGQYDRAAECVN